MDEPITLDKIIESLSEAPLFQSLDSAERAEVGRAAEVARLNAEQYVFREGESGDAWYVVFEGEAKVVQSARGAAPRTLATLSRGSIFGEMAVLDGSPRSASVIATEPLSLFRFRRKAFDELIAEGSLAAYKLVAAMARLLSERHRLLTVQITNMLADDNPVALSVREEARGLSSPPRVAV